MDEQGERIPDTPITIFPSADGENSPSQVRRRSLHSREDSRDVLRRLARVTSTSPSLESQSSKHANAAASDEKGPQERPADSSTDEGPHTKMDTKLEGPEGRAADDTRTFVDIAGLRRISSTDSASTKRSSIAHSDGDPIDRIEAEMKLFAPLDNQSERGSIRAPSPLPEDDEDEEEPSVEETPRPPKFDPVSRPTPKVTGAFVETPVTVKIDKAAQFEPDMLKPRIKKASPRGCRRLFPPWPVSQRQG